MSKSNGKRRKALVRRNSKRGPGDGKTAPGIIVRGSGVLLTDEHGSAENVANDRSKALALAKEPPAVSPQLLVMFIRNLMKSVSSDHVYLALRAMQAKCTPEEYDLFVKAIYAERKKGSVWPDGFMD
jgi:hypothetical protein